MKRVDIQKKINEECIRQVVLDSQMEGTRKLHDAALLLGDNGAAQVFRENMHTLLDAKLDGASSVMVLTRQLVEAPE